MCLYLHRSTHIYIHIYTYIYTNILFFLFSVALETIPAVSWPHHRAAPSLGRWPWFRSLYKAPSTEKHLIHRKNPPTTVHSVTSHATYTFKTVGMCHLGNGGLCDTRQPKWLQWFRHPMSGHGNLVLMVAPYECIYVDSSAAPMMFFFFSIFCLRSIFCFDLRFHHCPSASSDPSR